MVDFVNKNRRLFKFALITSPLIGLYSQVPILIVLDAFEVDTQALAFLDPSNILLKGVYITLTIFVQWVINIFLFSDSRILNRINPQFSKSIKYILSYSVGLVFLSSAVLLINTDMLKPTII